MKSSRILTALTAMLILIAAVGCSKDKPGPTGPTTTVTDIPAGLVGTWHYQSVTINGVDALLSDVLDFDPGTVAARLTIRASGSFLYEETGAHDDIAWIEKGTIDVKGNEVTITITSNTDGPVDPSGVSQGTFNLNTNQLETQSIVFGDVYDFVLTR